MPGFSCVALKKEWPGESIFGFHLFIDSLSDGEQDWILIGSLLNLMGDPAWIYVDTVIITEQRNVYQKNGGFRSEKIEQRISWIWQPAKL